MAQRYKFLSSVTLFFLMLAPSLSLFRVWPLNSAIADGLTFLFAGLLVATVLIGQKDYCFRWNISLYFFLSLLGALTISVWINDYSYESAWRWYLVSLFFCVVITAAGCEWKVADPGSFNSMLAAGLWTGCLVYSVISLLKYYGVIELFMPGMVPSSGRLSGIWYQPNLTTTTAWLGLLAGTVWLSGKSKPLWFIASVFIFGWVIACAASRISWLMVASLLALALVSQLTRFRVQETRLASLWLFWGVVGVSFMMLVVPMFNVPFRDWLTQIGLLQNGSVISLLDREVIQDTARLTEFRKLLLSLGGMNELEWLFGVGPGNYPEFSYSAELGVPPENLLSATWLHSHNLFTMMFVELGLVGLTLVTSFVGTIAWVALTRPYTLRHFFSVGALGLIFVHSNLEFPLWYPWFLSLCCLLLVNLFDVREVHGDSLTFKPLVGVVFLIMVVAMLVNVGYQYFRIVDVARDPDPGVKEYQTLSLLSNDSLMGPYAVLRKYRDFPPESINLDWQLKESRRMKLWQPRDLVVLREYSLLVLKKDLEAACETAQAVAYRYPPSAPIMLEHVVKAETLAPAGILKIANCIEKGLSPRGETIPSIESRNRKKLFDM